MTEFASLAAIIGTEDQKKAGRVFFADNEESAMSELKSAGYLLAVAFKIDAKTPPDKLETVKSYKKMMKDLEELKKAMDGKADDAKKAYAKAQQSVDEFLDGVELPLLNDPRYEPSA